jgi:hypothetical protein
VPQVVQVQEAPAIIGGTVILGTMVVQSCEASPSCRDSFKDLIKGDPNIVIDPTKPLGPLSIPANVTGCSGGT